MEKHEKVASFPCRGRKNLRVYSWYTMPDLKHYQKRFICISSLNVPEMKPLGTFKSILSNGYHENDNRQKNFDFSLGYVFPSSITVQSFITIKWQEKSYQLSKFSNFLFLTTLMHVLNIRKSLFMLVLLRVKRTPSPEASFMDDRWVCVCVCCFPASFSFHHPSIMVIIISS